MYHKDGGSGVQLVGAGGGRGAGGNGAPSWPSPSADGKYLYYQVSMATDTKELLSGSIQLRRFDLKTGETLDVTNGESNGAAAGRFSSGGGAIPEISPDGRWLAFGRQISDGLYEYKGHKYGPRSALWLRDMKTGAEKMVMDPIDPMVTSGSKTLGVLPRYKWAKDGKSIVLAQGGKIRRLGQGAPHDQRDGAQGVPRRRRTGRGEVLPLAERVARRAHDRVPGGRPHLYAGRRDRHAQAADRRVVPAARVRADVEPRRPLDRVRDVGRHGARKRLEGRGHGWRPAEGHQRAGRLCGSGLVAGRQADRRRARRGRNGAPAHPHAQRLV
jgi:hypothetical protein